MPPKIRIFSKKLAFCIICVRSLYPSTPVSPFLCTGFTPLLKLYIVSPCENQLFCFGLSAENFRHHKTKERNDLNNNFSKYIEKKLKATENFQKNEIGIDAPVSKKLSENILSLQNIFNGSSDIVFKEFETGSAPPVKGFVFYLVDLIDQDLLAKHVLHPLMQKGGWKNQGTDCAETAYENVISFGSIEKSTRLESAVQAVVAGRAAVFFEGCVSCLLIDLEKRKTRSVTAPQIEASVYGPRQAFVEDVKTNLSLLRNIIRSPRLIVERYTPKSGIKTPIFLLYLNGTVNTDVLKTLRNRLDRMNSELILSSESIKEVITEKRSFAFNTVGLTERPDRTAAKIMEGKVAILTDGSPTALTVPYLFVEDFQNAEDYYIPSFFASFSRIVRFASFVITLTIVPLYVAIATFQQEMLPLTLLITATASREGIPFPTFVEALIMLAIFDILREGGIRAPRPVGQTISFIGALIIGTAAVDAGIVSAPMVIIIALTGITALLNYSNKTLIIFLRIAFLFAAAFFGFEGIMIVLVVLVQHLCNLNSFGVSYLSPLSPYNAVKTFRDTLMRLPLRFLSYGQGETQKQN